ncbi:hypothetical protein AAFF_G00134300 [Aldrovandia affinis]|uniref:Uncharacterized protein n=1 Tax=Aldrovandia affinis TaxID=143900 RepID=A0AAD7RQC2_9TELE|nr:hypothetical protein AAFF_G00134300 [Aldrovandia affinis]
MEKPSKHVTSLIQPISADNLSCIVTHLSWRGELIMRVQRGDSKKHTQKAVSFPFWTDAIFIGCSALVLWILVTISVLKKCPKKSQHVEVLGIQTIYI